MSYDPLSPSEALRTPAGAVLAAMSLLILAYTMVIVGQILVGIIAVSVLSVGPYLWYRIFAAVDAVAGGVQRLAAAREREANRDPQFDRPADRDRSETRERPAEPATERKR